jgi:thiamine kinase-like enzyme
MVGKSMARKRDQLCKRWEKTCFIEEISTEPLQTDFIIAVAPNKKQTVSCFGFPVVVGIRRISDRRSASPNPCGIQEGFMIPEEKKTGLARALRQSFGVSEFENIQQLTAGLSSALVFRITVRNTPYLLRVITRADAMSDPTRQFSRMKSAAAAGLAPRVWYTSIEDRMSITDFVDAQPFPLADAFRQMPITLRAVHKLPAFTDRLKYVEHLLEFIKMFQAAKILPESETEELFERFGPLPAIYSRLDPELVPCHNDLKPENILFDGARVWLVDWEAAFLNDRYVDLSILANFLVADDAEEETFLRAYFGEAAGEYRIARFHLVRQIVNVFYVVVFLLFGSERKPISPHDEVPAFRDFHDRLWSGQISLASNEMKLQYGRVHMKQVLQNMREPRFEDAIRIVSEHPAG